MESDYIKNAEFSFSQVDRVELKIVCASLNLDPLLVHLLPKEEQFPLVRHRNRRVDLRPQPVIARNFDCATVTLTRGLKIIRLFFL